jgi:hypothetical protein
MMDKRKITKFSIFLNFRWGVGLSDGTISDHLLGEFTNSYSISVYYTVDECELDGETHRFEYSEGAIRPKTNGDEDVVGCGLLVDSNDKLAIFFTLNGTLCGKFILKKLHEILAVSHQQIKTISLNNNCTIYRCANSN